MNKKQLKKIFSQTKVKGISLILLEVLINGLILNFTLFSIFKLPFTWYSWIGYGFVPYILGEMIPRILIKFKQRIR